MNNQEYVLKEINHILRAKMTEQAEYILELEKKLDVVGEKEAMFKSKVKSIARKIRANRSK